MQRKMSDSEVLSMIRGMKYHWYEIFHHLGFSHEQLQKCKKKHPLEPELAMMEMISMWIEGSTPVPSWESLVSVLRYQLLENDIASRIEKVYGVQDELMKGKYYVKLLLFATSLYNIIVCLLHMSFNAQAKLIHVSIFSLHSLRGQID